MTNPIELEPCPFCGGEAVVEQQTIGVKWAAGCADADCLGFQKHFRFARRAEAITAWNTRTSSTRELAEALEPFAREAAHWSDSPDWADDEPLNEAESSLTVGDLRRARTALSKHRGQG